MIDKNTEEIEMKTSGSPTWSISLLEIYLTVIISFTNLGILLFNDRNMSDVMGQNRIDEFPIWLSTLISLAIAILAVGFTKLIIRDINRKLSLVFLCLISDSLLITSLILIVRRLQF